MLALLDKRNKTDWKLTGVVPWPAVLAPGEDVANVMAKPPFSALSMKLYQYGKLVEDTLLIRIRKLEKLSTDLNGGEGMAAAASADKDGSCEFLEDGFEESIAGRVQSFRLTPCGCRNWCGEGSRSEAEEKRRGASSCDVRLRRSPFGKFFDSVSRWLFATVASCSEE